MKKVGNHNSISRRIHLSLAIMLLFSFSSFSQATPPPAPAASTMPAANTGADPVAGKALFNTNCAACHRADAGGQIGPNLTDDLWILGGGIKNIFHTLATI